MMTLKHVTIGILLLFSGVVGGCDSKYSPSASSFPQNEDEALQRAEQTLQEFEGKNAANFERFLIGERIVYYWQRMVEEATVDGDFKNYQFDRHTGEFLEKFIHWRDEVPERLPRPLITQQEAERIAGGRVKSSFLCIISPESPNFRIQPTPKNPCWIVSLRGEDDEMCGGTINIIDAVTGTFLGYGTPPPC
jgi:hypothetical protein